MDEVRKVSADVERLERELDAMREARDAWFDRYQKVVDILDRIKGEAALKASHEFVLATSHEPPR